MLPLTTTTICIQIWTPFLVWLELRPVLRYAVRVGLGFGVRQCVILPFGLLILSLPNKISVFMPVFGSFLPSFFISVCYWFIIFPPLFLWLSLFEYLLKKKKKKSLFEYLFLTKMFKVINYWIIKIIIIKIKSIQVFVFFFYNLGSV